jgi:glycosyltransferase involved in cell wall biosynthesis
VKSQRLLHIVGSSKFGGDSILIVELGSAAREHGFHVDVLATDPPVQDLVREAGLGLVDVDLIRREIRPLWDTRGFVRLMSFLRRAPYAIVHTHTSKPGMVGRLAAKRAHVPAIIHTPHLLPFHEETGNATTGMYVAAERIAARWCDRIVAVSEHQRIWMLNKGIGTADQVIAIPNGVPVERVVSSKARDDVRSELGVADAFLVVSTGRLAEQKGIEFLIRAVSLLPDALNVRIVLAGDGPLRQQLSDLISVLGVEDTVTLLGHRSDVGDLLAAADLVVLPSLWEGLSISLLEAMAAGKPVVTTTLGSNIEVTNGGEAAMLVPPKDPVRLASAIRALAADTPVRALLGERAQGVQRERYTIGRMIDSYLDEYDQLLKKTSTEISARPLRVERVS